MCVLLTIAELCEIAVRSCFSSPRRLSLNLSVFFLLVFYLRAFVQVLKADEEVPNGVGLNDDLVSLGELVGGRLPGL